MKKLLIVLSAVMLFGFVVFLFVGEEYPPNYTSRQKVETPDQIKARVQEERGRARAEEAREQARTEKARIKREKDLARQWAKEEAETVKPKQPKDAVILEEYFGDMATSIPEIHWIRFNGNSVFIGFNPIPSDTRTILGFWAFGGWKIINFGCHIYAYDASRYGPTTDGNFFAGATCRYGKVKHY